MPDLNIPVIELKINKLNGKDFVFDSLRKQFVRLNPEEFVRQNFIAFLINCKNYPKNRLANEITIELGNLKRRCDTVLYDEYLQPLMIIEYKSPTVTITQKTFDQIGRYNMSLNVPWLIVSNGIRHYCCKIDTKNQKYTFCKDIPDYCELKN